MKTNARKRKLLMNTIFLVMILLIAILLGILGIMQIRKDKNLDMQFFLPGTGDRAGCRHEGVSDCKAVCRRALCRL